MGNGVSHRGNYNVERVITSNKGSVIWLRQQGPKDPNKPELLYVYDKDNNGIDAGDEIGRGYDFAYQLKAVYQQIVRTKRLPKTIRGEPVVGGVVDGGISTKRNVIAADIARWKSKLNPYFALGRRHRLIMKFYGLKVQRGSCIEKAAPGSLAQTVEVDARFVPPLTIKTPIPRKRVLFWSSTYTTGNAPVRKNPAQCLEASGKSVATIYNVSFSVEISTRVAIGALLSRNVFSSFPQSMHPYIAYSWKNGLRLEHINVQ